MPWTDTARKTDKRKTDRYPSDLTDEEWAIIQPIVTPARSGGRPRSVDMREEVNAIFYIGSTGCQWRALPSDFLPMTSVQGYFYDWQNAGVLDAMTDLLVMSARELEDRDGAPDLLKAIGKRFPWLRHIFADGGYAGDKLRQAMGDEWTLEIIKRPDTAKGFVLLPWRWVVECIFA